jgi:hypothetical protein
MLASCGGRPTGRADRTALPALNAAGNSTWHDVRQQFRLSDDLVHMSALFIASHPTPVRDAIERLRPLAAESHRGVQEPTVPLVSTVGIVLPIRA